MFYKEAEAHMRIDVYASSLVMWEVGTIGAFAYCVSNEGEPRGYTNL